MGTKKLTGKPTWPKRSPVPVRMAGFGDVARRAQIQAVLYFQRKRRTEESEISGPTPVISISGQPITTIEGGSLNLIGT
jgi:hypothetical protein